MAVLGGGRFLFSEVPLYENKLKHLRAFCNPLNSRKDALCRIHVPAGHNIDEDATCWVDERSVPLKRHPLSTLPTTTPLQLHCGTNGRVGRCGVRGVFSRQIQVGLGM